MRQTYVVDSVVGIVISVFAIGIGGLFISRAESIAVFMAGIFFGDDVQPQTITVLSWALRAVAFLVVAVAVITLSFGVLGL